MQIKAQSVKVSLFYIHTFVINNVAPVELWKLGKFQIDCLALHLCVRSCQAQPTLVYSLFGTSIIVCVLPYYQCGVNEHLILWIAFVKTNFRTINNMYVLLNQCAGQSGRKPLTRLLRLSSNRVYYE